MCIFVSARLQATAAPDAPAPMISTSTGSFILVFPSWGPAFGDPGRHRVVAVGQVILGDVICGGVPDAIVAENVAQRLVEMLCGIRASDIVRMQRQAHHA